VNETELWITQARKYLKAARWTGGGRLARSLGDHMTRIDLARMQADLGCGEQCAACSWGFLGSHALPCEPCRVLAFQEAVETLQKRAAGTVATRREAATLLTLLDRLPSHRGR
jgi:hypothetical protein